MNAKPVSSRTCVATAVAAAAMVAVVATTAPADVVATRAEAVHVREEADGSAVLPNTGRTDQDQDNEPITAAAYHALALDEAGADVRLLRWSSRSGSRQLTSRIGVTNVSANAATVLLSLYDYEEWPIDGCGEACTATLPAGATHTWWLPDLPGMPEDDGRRAGRALVRSTGPIVVAVHEVALAPLPDPGYDSSAYGGVAADATNGGALELHAPALLNGVRLGAIGTGDSVVDVWNLHPSEATTATLRLQPQSIAQPHKVAAHLEPGSGAILRPFESEWVRVVDVHAGHLTADRPTAALVRTDWSAELGSSAYRGAVSGTDVVLPVVSGAFVNRCSQITIQNTDLDADAPVSLGFYPATGGYTKHIMRLTLPAGGSRTITPCADADLASALGLGFLGAMRAVSMDGETRFAVQTFLDVVGTKAVAGWAGRPIERAAEVLHAPIVHAGWPIDAVSNAGLLTTTLAVTNPEDSPIEVNVTYSGVSGSCVGSSHIQGPTVVLGWGTQLFEPGVDEILPQGCIAAARIEASAPVFALVYDEGYAAPAASGPRDTLLPYAAR